MDLSPVSNPAVSMEWTDANRVVYTGETSIPPGATDITGGALPGGSVRWRNVGSFEGQAFDLLVTVPLDLLDSLVPSLPEMIDDERHEHFSKPFPAMVGVHCKPVESRCFSVVLLLLRAILPGKC